MAIKHVVLLVGGVGGAKLAYGFQQILAPEQLTVIVNTGDDFWHYGLRICPDLDTIMYTLAGVVDHKNGWGIQHDTHRVLGMLQQLGENTWFRLGDLDLATHIIRTRQLQEGQTLTQVTQFLTQHYRINHQILPMTDDNVSTIVQTREYGEMEFQPYFVEHRWQPTVQALHYRGAEHAQLSPAVLDALNDADAIVIGPSNPWLSISPILNIPAMKIALLARDVPRIAVTPLIGGQAIKGPTAKIMRELNIPVTPASIIEFYGDILNGFVYDERDHQPSVETVRLFAEDTLMLSDYHKSNLARALLTIIENWNERS
ncbi:MAG: 2-phospho-L-lactate transferase [Phototrophicaceae bacterium]